MTTKMLWVLITDKKGGIQSFWKLSVLLAKVYGNEWQDVGSAKKRWQCVISSCWHLHMMVKVMPLMLMMVAVMVIILWCRFVWLWQPSEWQARTVWWRIWKQWKLWAPRRQSAPTRRAHWPRTAWLSLTCGSITRSLKLTPAKISHVSYIIDWVLYPHTHTHRVPKK